MFVEKLKKEDIISFIKANCVDNVEYEKAKPGESEEYKRLREFSNDWKKQEIDRIYDTSRIKNYETKDGKISFEINSKKFTFTDFDFIQSGVIKLKSYALDTDWLKFMASKFGDEYKKAFATHRQQEKEEYLKNESKKFDDYTKTCKDELNF